MRNHEQEISVKEILWGILFGWRCLVVCAIIFAVVMPIFFYLENKSQIEDIDNYVIEEEEMKQIETQIVGQQVFEDMQTYLDESVLMNVNPYQEKVWSLKYYVDSDYQYNYTENNKLDYTRAITAAYSEYVQSGELARALMEALELDLNEEYVVELINVRTSESPEMFVVEVVYPDEDIFKQMAEFIDDQIRSQTGCIIENIGSHSLKLISEDTVIKSDLDLANTQQEVRDTLSSLEAKLNAERASMTKEQLQYIENLENERKPGDSQEEQRSVTQERNLLIYIILGIIMGVVVGVILVTARLLFSGKLRSGDKLSEVYGLRLLGVIQKQNQISGIDKILQKVKNKHKKQVSEQECMDLIVSNIELACRKDDVRQIFVTGSEVANVKETIIQMINMLKDSGISAVYGENICYNVQSLCEVAEIGKVVIVEQAGLSCYQEIDNEIKLILDQKADIIGGIGIDFL